MYGIEERTKNLLSFDDTVLKLQSMNIFLTIETFKENEGKILSELEEVRKIKSEFDRYVPHSVFNEFKEQQAGIAANQDKKIEQLYG
jgi:phage I-like protein